MNESELTLLVRIIVDAGFVVTGAHYGDHEVVVVSVKAPPVRA